MLGSAQLGLIYIPNRDRERSVQMEALSRVKELFPNLAGISSGEIAALFERFDERTRDDAGSSEDLPKGSSDAGWLGMPFTQVEDDEEEWVDYVDWTALAASTGAASTCTGAA